MQPHIPIFRSRRDFLRLAGGGFGALAFAAMAGGARTRGGPFLPKKPHFEPKAKSVIFLFMEGGPSHIDLFDPKPELTRLHGKPLPPSFGKVITPMGTGGNTLLASKRKFTKHGQSGLEVSDWLPHIADVRRRLRRDPLVLGRRAQPRRQRLPDEHRLDPRRPAVAGVVGQLRPGHREPEPARLRRPARRPGEPLGGARNWGTGFMPAAYQGTQFRDGPTPDPATSTRPPSVGDDRQQAKLDLLERAQRASPRRARPATPSSTPASPPTSWPSACRPQPRRPSTSSQETEETKELYGLDRKETAEFGRNCLLARRLVERGVRFVQLYCGAGSKWDAHSDIEGNHTEHLPASRPARSPAC